VGLTPMKPSPMYTATLSGKSTLLDETLAVLRELDRGHNIAEVKAMVMEADLLGKLTQSTRKSVWDHLHTRYLSDEGRAATLAHMVTRSRDRQTAHLVLFFEMCRSLPVLRDAVVGCIYPRYAAGFSGVGLVERTGRGISIIYAGQLRNGRPAPSYDRSTDTSITVTLDSGSANLAFVESAIQASKLLGRSLTVAELLVLWEARTMGSVTVAEVARLAQSDRRAAQLLLRGLQQSELVMSFSSSGQRAYRLGPALSGSGGHVSVGPSLASLTMPQLEDQLMAHAHQHGRIQRGEVEALSGLSRDQVYRLLRRLVKDGRLELVGRGQTAFYRPIPKSGDTA